MPLTWRSPGAPVAIRKISGKDDIKRFLASLGFAPGEEISIVSENDSSMIVRVKDLQVALDRTLATRIQV